MEAGGSKLLDKFIGQIQSMKLHRAPTLGAALKKPLLLLLLVSRIDNQRVDQNHFHFSDVLVVQADGGLPIESLAGRDLAVRPRSTRLGEAFLEWHRKNVYLGI